MIRFFDFTLSLIGLVCLFPLLLVLFVVGLIDTGSPLFIQQRVGKKQIPFLLMKFRTMKVGTASVASHLADNASITKYGRFLRKSKLDELPQLLNVLKGEMSLVGPRPCLASQYELISEREKLSVFAVRPGITGLAQVNDIDMSTPVLLAKTDAEMISTMDVFAYFKYILQTITGRGAGDRIPGR
jgi:lipopolysaccharide/colanic/teichoic acid biosynthesis glycosyltransferase